MENDSSRAAEARPASGAATSFDAEPEVAPERLPDEVRQLLLRLARASLAAQLQQQQQPPLPPEPSVLWAPRAVFVTLRRRDNGDLRGCRGESRPRRPLVEAVPAMTIAAATNDPRFMPVTADELPWLNIEISALTPLQTIHPDQIVPGRHGLLLVAGQRGGLLLPQVALTHGWDRLAYLEALCLKAGLPPGAWQDPDTILYSFESEVWPE